MRWVEHKKCEGGKGNVYMVMLAETAGKRLHRRLMCGRATSI